MNYLSVPREGSSKSLPEPGELSDPQTRDLRGSPGLSPQAWTKNPRSFIHANPGSCTFWGLPLVLDTRASGYQHRRDYAKSGDDDEGCQYDVSLLDNTINFKHGSSLTKKACDLCLQVSACNAIQPPILSEPTAPKEENPIRSDRQLHTTRLDFNHVEKPVTEP